MGKRLAAAIICLLVLAAAAWAAGERPQFSHAGIYEVTYDIDQSGKMRIKTLTLRKPTEEVTAAPGIAFGVCCQEIRIKGEPPQAGFVHPEANVDTRFWGVDTAFEVGGTPARFYGFVFEKGSRPVPGNYAVSLFRADDGSLLGRQAFRVVGAPKAGGQK